MLRKVVAASNLAGITIGIGYDIGYNSVEVFNQDWQKLGDVERKRLSGCGLIGEVAKQRLACVRDIIICWELAWEVFNVVRVLKFYNLTKKAFPGFAV